MESHIIHFTHISLNKQPNFLSKPLNAAVVIEIYKSAVAQ